MSIPIDSLPAENRQRLREKFETLPTNQHTGGWDDLWQQEFTPWDRKGPSLALKDAITGHPEVFGGPVKSEGGERKRAFVPGCGRGYDVLLLSSLGYNTYGLDASQTAVETARKYKTAHEDDEVYAPHDATIGRGEAKFIFSDFFKDDFFSETNGGKFDVIFDYTFLCALPPELRQDWTKRMSELLAPDGKLVCLEWPLGKDPKEGGPPHGLTSSLYEALFSRPGEKVRYNESGVVEPDQGIEKNDDSLVRVAHYRPERTHEAGKTSDYISIWKHWKS
ncbi:hypothetical protein M409DRAFT_25910 [Zasmidium cellare ATCC 36951]|uniref:Methyltransferase domain-containing protein n=1 Tax=Zasmidium cellare ATCC 36951 TaxID=1080233 RepID=A0A6A6C9A3_ZASCE|nr:uncharacterized protein M409DRAFT_25910 [Zasmidium cellare ATCC 36951]KAF2163724.1 hypothetical protein M409DRAFT_25910 [Zasmidium cellare ATCC 36951]